MEIFYITELCIKKRMLLFANYALTFKKMKYNCSHDFSPLLSSDPVQVGLGEGDRES